MIFIYLFVFLALGLSQAVADSPNLIQGGDMNSFVEGANPWGGVDASNNLHGLYGTQYAVDDNGTVGFCQLSPSVAIGDLNGDGLPDLVMADPKGFFWFYANSGTKTAPKFTNGEVMPIWLGEDVDKVKGEKDWTLLHRSAGGIGGYDRLVPRIQLVSLDQSAKLDLVVGTFIGKLFFIPNTGSTSQPKFVTPKNLSELRFMATRSDGNLDCNYASPYLYDWFSAGKLDLIRGDGTYSANSILLFTNKGTTTSPLYNETASRRIIEGYGREHLTPVVIDWNHDGKPDILTGERTGQVEIFLNTTTDPKNPTFDKGTPITVGNVNRFGQFTTVAVGPLTGNPQAPDLIIANDSGQLLFCHNTGTQGAPAFAAPPVPLQGVNPYPKINIPNYWSLGGYDWGNPARNYGNSNGMPYGVPYETLTITNASKEQGFTMPDGSTQKNALKYSVVDHKSVYFPDTYYPSNENIYHRHVISYARPDLYLQSGVRYQLSYWIKGDGVRDLTSDIWGEQLSTKPHMLEKPQINMTNTVNFSNAWSKVTENISWDSQTDKKPDTIPMRLNFFFFGQGNLYLSDIQLHQL